MYVLCIHERPNFSLIFSIFLDYMVHPFFFSSNYCKSPKIYFLKKTCVSGPMQFRLGLFKSQLCVHIYRYIYPHIHKGNKKWQQEIREGRTGRTTNSPRASYCLLHSWRFCNPSWSQRNLLSPNSSQHPTSFNILTEYAHPLSPSFIYWPNI